MLMQPVVRFFHVGDTDVGQLTFDARKLLAVKLEAKGLRL
jgi:hypothetical protein